MTGSTLPIDRSNFPTLRTRKALLVIDCQNDFVAENGPLRATDPDGYLQNIVLLASAFRSGGDVVWVRTEYGNRQIHQEDEIIASNAPAAKPRGRGRPSQRGPSSITDAEAFLGVEGPDHELCARKGTKGAEFPDEIQKTIGTRDRVFTKSHYSAFKSGELLAMLRMRFVTEIYLCGSLFNIGVFATAVDAARHGYEITLVDDCCGYRSPLRYSKAKKKVEELTGCDIVDMDTAIQAVSPETRSKQDGDSNAATRTVEVATAKPSPSSKPPTGDPKGAQDSKSDDILVSSLSKLKLAGGEDAGGKARAKPRAGIKAVAQPQTAALENSTKFDTKPSASAAITAKTRSGDKTRKTSPDADESTSDRRTRDAGEEKPAIEPRPLTHEVEIEIGINKLSLSDEKEGGKGDNIHSQVSSLESNPKAKPDKKTADGTTPNTPQQPSSSGSGSGSGSGSDSGTKSPSRHKTATFKGAATTGTTSTTALASAKTSSKTLIATTTGSMAETFCEGDTTIIHDLLPPPLEDDIFETLKTEVEWAKMSHQGGEVPRLVAVQGEVDVDGNHPLYRHPSDESPPLYPFTPSVRAIKEAAEKHLNHQLNHVLIQWYRDGHDYISEHSDKTLDIAPNSFVANVSLGAQRTMVLRTKRQDKKHVDRDEKATTTAAGSQSEGPRRQAVRVPLPHNSLFKMGLQTNMHWLHGIRQDKRTVREKTEPELAYGGARISLTFRQIGTYMDKTGKLIWGQGATGKTRNEAHDVINGQTPEAIQMLKAFGTENHASEFDWSHYYGAGFDVLHMYAAARLFTSPDATVNNRVQMMLAELGISYARGSISSSTSSDKDSSSSAADHQHAVPPTGTPIMFVDNDDTRTAVEDEMAIMIYLDQVYGGEKLRKGERRTNAQLAQQISRFHHAFHLCRWWREVCSKDENKNTRLGKLRKALSKFDGYIESVGEKGEDGDVFICGKEVTIADFAFFATLHEIVQDPKGGGVGILATFPKLKRYHDSFRRRDSTVAILGAVPPAAEEEKKTKRVEKKKLEDEEEEEKDEGEKKDEEKDQDGAMTKGSD